MTPRAASTRRVRKPATWSASPPPTCGGAATIPCTSTCGSPTLTAHDDLPVAARARRLEERLIAAGLTSDDEIDEYLTELYTKASPVNGARMVARAWTDPRYRDLLLSDGNAAAAQAGFDGLSYQLQVVANTEQ